MLKHEAVDHAFCLAFNWLRLPVETRVERPNLSSGKKYLQRGLRIAVDNYFLGYFGRWEIANFDRYEDGDCCSNRWITSRSHGE
eukprot:scaffold13560_cov161-Cylindrotheca_fusiformis.AAC.4